MKKVPRWLGSHQENSRDLPSSAGICTAPVLLSTGVAM